MHFQSKKAFLLLFLLQFCSVQGYVQKKGFGTKLHKIFLFKGTKWCGPGKVAKSYDDLGVNRETDKCCRTHDLNCSLRIYGFHSKYDLFNFSWKPASSCDCEVRFKECLENVEAFAAKELYEIYFNVIRPRCIRVKTIRIKKCVDRNWYHKCTKYDIESKKQGYFVDLHEAISSF